MVAVEKMETPLRPWMSAHVSATLTVRAVHVHYIIFTIMSHLHAEQTVHPIVLLSPAQTDQPEHLFAHCKL